jgi:hypothetical protein
MGERSRSKEITVTSFDEQWRKMDADSANTWAIMGEYNYGLMTYYRDGLAGTAKRRRRRAIAFQLKAAEAYALALKHRLALL